MNKAHIKFKSLLLSLGFLVTITSFSTALAADDIDAIFSKTIKECNKLIIKGGTSGNVATPDTPDREARIGCAQEAIIDLEKKRKSCPRKDTECREAIASTIDRLEVTYGVPESKSAERRKERCEAYYNDDQEIYKECSKVPAKQARSCAKAMSSDGGFMNSEEMQMAAPMLGMVSGADTLLGIYSAMNDRPDCTLSKEDFRASEDKMEEQKKELEEKVKENMKEAEDAQKEYSEKLSEWADKEGEITDELNAMPGKTEESLHNLDNEKLKAKMQADSEYNKIVEQMGEIRRKYNDLVAAKAVALAENSDFAIHDRCAIIATGGDPSKQSASASKQPTQAVQASFAGAFAQGKVTAINVQKRYESCVKTEALKQKRVESSVMGDLAAMKAKLASLDAALGQINEGKRKTDEEIIYQMQNIQKKAAGRVKELAADYLRIQNKKSLEQNNLKQTLARLDSDTKKYQQQLAILNMKLSMYKDGSRRPMKYSDDKSMKEMLAQCGESYKNVLENFQDDCCEISADRKTRRANYSGSGASVCRMDYSEYDPKKLEEAKKAKKSK